MHKLAIVIPAYKIDFFENTLKSLASQTCKNFTVYIGVDASPNDFTPIIKKYKEIIDIVYKRFEENIGGKDLVAQWNRCIDLTQGEEWIWLFSDDDELDENCVEEFYTTIQKEPSATLLHFNVQVIDSNSSYVTKHKYVKKDFPKLISAKEYAKARLTYQINSFVVEYIFKRDIFEEVGRWQNFDLAWGTDDATWIKLANNKGILTIDKAKVKWRLSDKNITPCRDSHIALRKVKASVNFLNFLAELFQEKNMEKLYYWYFTHAIYNAMKDCTWDDIKSVIYMYREKHKDIIPVLLWKLIYKLLHI